MTDADAFLSRLDGAEERFAGHAARPSSAESLTSADPASGERWEAGQVWAHVAEFIPYWIEQAQHVIDGFVEDPVPFGRTKSDSGRIAAIERGRGVPVSVLWSETHSDLEALRQFVRGLTEHALRARGLHPTMGVMTTAGIVEEFLVGHLEQHADQLDELTRGT